MFISGVTPKGNSSFSHISQEDAESNAKVLDDADCRNCTYCIDCTYCTNCTYCRNCTYCTNCTDCTDCRNCTDCTDCTDCTEQPIVIVGLLPWVICIRKNNKTLKIGCQDHSIESWQNISEQELEKLSDNALSLYRQHKEAILNFFKE